jgi:hypothetical protein
MPGKIKLRNIIKEEYGSIYQLDNPYDPEVLIQGFGRMRWSQLKKHIENKIEDEIITMAKRGDYSALSSYLFAPHNSFKLFVDAANDINKELNSPTIKRKITLLKGK